MAYYCTVADLADSLSERVLIQLTDDSTPPVSVDHGRCLAAIEEASEVIDARLRARYSALPLAEPIPALIRGICVDIAAYRLYSRRNRGDITTIYQRYKAALEMLDKMRLSEASLGPEATGDSTTASRGAYRVSRRLTDRIFTDDVLRRY